MIIPFVNDKVYDKTLNEHGIVISTNVYKLSHIQSIKVLYKDFSKIYVGAEIIPLRIMKI